MAFAPSLATSGASSSGDSTRPSRFTGTPKRLEAPHTRRSHMTATPSPPPTQSPSMRAMVGWRQARTASRAAPRMPA